MKNTKRALSALLAALMCTSVTAYTATAVEVSNINGVPTAFVSSFGKLTYNAKAQKAYKTMAEGLEALGNDGGKIVLQGNYTLDDFIETPGRAPLEIIGLGTRASGNTITVKSGLMSLGGNFTASNIVIDMPASGYIVTNGYNFKAFGGFDSYFKTTYNAGSADTITYPNPISVTAGSFSSDNKIELLSGCYKTVSVGSAGSNGTGTVTLKLSHIKAQSVVLGSDSGSFNVDGSIFADISNCEIDSLSSGYGTVSGDLVLISESNNIANYNFADTLDVAGSSVLITDTDTDAQNFDKHIVVTNGKAYPKTENGKIKGFCFTDNRGINTATVNMNGVVKTSESGVFEIPDGKTSVTPIESVEIRLNAENGYVSGYSDGTFLPQNNMTRAEAMTLLARIIADEKVFKNLVSADYADVAADAWYSPYIGLFQKLDLLDKLEEDSKILPDAKITRAEFCQLISGIYTSTFKKLGGMADFSDVPQSHKHFDAIGVCGFADIVTGYEDGTFRPENNVTRAEAVTMINRLIGRVPAKNSTASFKDISDHWAKAQINAAANPAQKDGVEMWTTESTNKFDEYMQYRSSLTNTMLKLEKEKKLDVAFIGGSITAGSGASSVNETSWRGRTVQYFKESYPDCEINSVNAAIGDSYTKYAVYRMDNDLLKYDFDLLFVEYAINDSPWYSAKKDTETVIYFETLIRRVYEHNPKADIVIVYTIDDKISRLPKYFDTARAQEVIAKHYDIPSVNFGRALADHLADNNYKWSDFFKDYVHPNDKGHLYYGCVLSEYLANALDPQNCGTQVADRVLPEKHTDKELWYDLTMLEANQIDLSLSKNWALSEDGKKIYPTAEDNELVVKTYGSDICIASPRDDLMYYSVDGGEELHMKMNRKPQTLFEGLSDGEHTLRIRAEDITKLSIQRLMYNGKK